MNTSGQLGLITAKLASETAYGQVPFEKHDLDFLRRHSLSSGARHSYDGGRIKQYISRCQSKSYTMLDSKGFWARVCEALGLAEPTKIAAKIGISKHSVYLWQKGEMPGANKLKNLSRVAELSNISLHWLLTGEGPKRLALSTQISEPPADYNTDGEIPGIYLGAVERQLVAELAAESGRDVPDQIRELVIEGLIERGLVTDKAEGANLIFFSDHVPKLVPMKLLGTIAAGQPIQVFEQSETVQVAEDFVVKGRGGFVLRVTGDSMIEDGIHDGDLIICYESKTANNGQMIVALIDGDQATVKRFYKEKGRIRLQPANPRYKPLILSADQVTIQGIVIGIQRRP